MIFSWTRRLPTPPREANDTREQKTVVINREANRPFGQGLFGGSLMWVVEALASAPAQSCLYFQAFNDAYELPAGVQTTRSCRDKRVVAVPRWADDVIDFLLEQRTIYSPSAEV